MWKRCWWATWLSGFFGIAGLAHVARPWLPVRIIIAGVEVPVAVSVWAGVVLLAVSAGLLWLEVARERAKRHADLPR